MYGTEELSKTMGPIVFAFSIHSLMCG